MNLASLTLLWAAVGSAEPIAHGSHGHAAEAGKSIVRAMLHAIDRRDATTFDRVVEKRGLIEVQGASAPLSIDMLPANLACGDPDILDAEASQDIAGDSKVRVGWACKARSARPDGRTVVQFWVHGGKVIFGEQL